MAEEDEYELLPQSSLEKLKSDLDSLKRSAGSSGGVNKEAVQSISDLKDSIDKLLQLFAVAADEMKKEVNISNFELQRKELIPELGKHLNMEFVATHKNPDNVIVIWRLSFTNRDIPVLLTYVFVENESKLQISGAMLQT